MSLTTLGFTRAEISNLLGSMPEADRAELLQIVRQLDERSFYRLDPVSWIEDKLGIARETLVWSMNGGYFESGRVDEHGDIIEAGWDGTPDPIVAILRGLAGWQDVAVESATGTGKTFLASCVILWFLSVFPGATVVTVAPTESHLVRNLWKEVTKRKKAFLEHHPDAMFQSLRIKMAPDDDELSEAWTAYGFVAGVGASEESATRARGIHAEHLLFVMDEQNGIDPAVLEAIENTCTAPHNLRLALGNPNSVTDTLHQMAVQPTVTHIRVSAYDHPNIVGNDPDVDIRDHHEVVPGAVSWKRIFKARGKYGPEPEFYNVHALYQAFVRGICPTGSVQNLFTGKVFSVVEAHLKANPTAAALEAGLVEETPHVAQGGERLEGWTRVYARAEHTHTGRYIIFADVAGDDLDGDWHAAVVYDRVTCRPAAIVRMRGHRRYYALELVRLGELYRTFDWRTETWHWPLLAWETNAVGALHLVEEFAAYPYLYRPRATDRPKKGKPRNAWGHYTSSKTRPGMIAELEEWGLGLRENPGRVVDEVLLEEMRVFEYHARKRRYQHRDGEHDDLLMALSGALLLAKTQDPPRPLPPKPDPEMERRARVKARHDREAKRQARRARNGSGGYGTRFDGVKLR